MNNTEECNCSICKAERLGNAQKYIDWDKPLRITTHNGTFKVYNLGIGWKDKRLVQIEECSARFPSHDGGLPNVFAPDESGYVVQFDTWIENEPDRIIVNLTDKVKYIIQRNGKEVYRDN